MAEVEMVNKDKDKTHPEIIRTIFLPKMSDKVPAIMEPKIWPIPW